MSPAFGSKWPAIRRHTFVSPTTQVTTHTASIPIYGLEVVTGSLMEVQLYSACTKIRWLLKRVQAIIRGTVGRYSDEQSNAERWAANSTSVAAFFEVRSFEPHFTFLHELFAGSFRLLLIKHELSDLCTGTVLGLLRRCLQMVYGNMEFTEKISCNVRRSVGTFTFQDMNETLHFHNQSIVTSSPLV